MSGLDYQRIEQELQQQLHPLATYQSPGLQGTHGWSTAALGMDKYEHNFMHTIFRYFLSRTDLICIYVLEESDSDENFLPLRGANVTGTGGGMCDSVMSGVSSSMESSLSSSMASSLTEHTTRTRRKGKNRVH